VSQTFGMRRSRGHRQEELHTPCVASSSTEMERGEARLTDKDKNQREEERRMDLVSGSDVRIARVDEELHEEQVAQKRGEVERCVAVLRR
jgi:hypothetical protein